MQLTFCIKLKKCKKKEAFSEVDPTVHERAKERN